MASKDEGGRTESGKTISWNHSSFILTGMEFSLLELLVSNSGRPYSRSEILQSVWSYPPENRIDTRAVDVHISRLRSKLETDISNPELILTARGIGYMFQNRLKFL